MKISNTSTRLKKIMTDNNMRQVDILKKVEPYCQVYNIKMNKSDISQYVSGKVEPSQDKLVILSMALNVSKHGLWDLMYQYNATLHQILHLKL